jgi:hypothetical protein
VFFLAARVVLKENKRLVVPRICCPLYCYSCIQQLRVIGCVSDRMLGDGEEESREQKEEG